MNLAAITSGIILMAASAWLITSASFHPPLSTLAIGITLVRAAGLLRAIFRYLERYLTHTAIFAQLTQIRVNLYKFALMKFPLKSGETGEAELLHDLTVGADQLKNFFPRVVQPILSTLLITIFVTVYLFEYIGNIALLLLISVLSTLVISYMFMNIQEIDDTSYREMVLDFHDGREELIIAGSTQIAITKLNEEVEALRRNEKFNRNKLTNIDTICNLINVTAFVVILNELASCVNIIDLAVWAFILISTQDIFISLPNTVKNFINIKRNNKFEYELEEEIIDTSPQNSTVAIEISNLQFGYSERNSVIKNLSLKVKCGEHIAIMGDSGSGKTTLLYLLLRLWTPSSGRIIINGSIAAATANNYIFSESISKNFFMLHPDITQEKILDSLKICQLDEINIDSELGENGCKISGGERCRLQTSLALAADSDILILDEPTAGLDRRTANNLMSNIIKNSIEKDRTLIVITHDLSIANMMNVIYKIYDGKIIYEG